MLSELGADRRASWTPRLSRAFQDSLRKGKTRTASSPPRKLSDRTVNRAMSHLKTLAAWAHKLSPFPLGNPMEKVRLLPVGTGLEVERALTPAERRGLLDAADLLAEVGGRSSDRNRYRNSERPTRKGFRGLRNRAIVYLLVETGCRRSAVTSLNVAGIDFRRKTATVVEKGGLNHTYRISREGLEAVRDYLERERPQDAERWQSPALFLSANTNPHGDGRLTSQVVNDVWNQLAAPAGVEGRTPHSARHAMGRLLVERTGNVAAVQRQLGHRNASYAMQYARLTAEELREAIEDR